MNDVEAAGPLQVLSLLLILRSFSSGAVALTGVEAISDGVPAFEKPEWRNARTTLTWAAVVFGTLFLGIGYLVVAAGIIPDANEQETVLSQLARLVSGDGPYLYLVQISTALLLVLAANTSFADFPRLSSFLARDGYLPRQFAFRGERLAFTTGILALAGLAVALIIAFGAKVSALIPLYTLGVFLAFTLGQAGMLVALVAAARARVADRDRHHRQRNAHDVPRPAGGRGQQLHPRRVADHRSWSRC